MEAESSVRYNEDNFPPRNYQLILMNIALKENTIIFLPTGSGKTYIAIMVIKSLSQDLLKPYNEGGKLTVVLVNSVTLVHQHEKNIGQHTNFSIGSYTGEMNVDFWSKETWHVEFNKHQILIMTAQIMLNLLNQSVIDLNKVNLLIFDECHHGVNDHAMRQVMFHFENCKDQPRVLGLTATLLNGNCKPYRVMDAVRSLEVTYHSKIATVDELASVVGYSTNPKEHIEVCSSHTLSEIEMKALWQLDRIADRLSLIEIEDIPKIGSLMLKRLEPDEGLRKLVNLIKDLRVHIQELGVYAGVKSCIGHMVVIERLKLHCDEIELHHLLNGVLTIFGTIKAMFMSAMRHFTEKDMIHKFSSDKVRTLFKIFKNFNDASKEELCCLLFVQRRSTAKVLYHVLQRLAKVDSDFNHIKSNFMVGANANPYSDSRENLYVNKKNKQIMNSFRNKEINILVASNLLEEGVDIIKCTLVIKFDKPEQYRSYIQSKGRARHKTSHYHIIVESGCIDAYEKKYNEFQEIEEVLNKFLIGKNDDRVRPSASEIQLMYDEQEISPYYVDGPNSAQVNLLSAISLLCQYCASLHSDRYTTYAPDWYIQTQEVAPCVAAYSVVILMPVVCPIREKIDGPFMSSKWLAKKAAALEACKQLHKCGELDDLLLPKKHTLPEKDVSFLFKHWPETKEAQAGNSKKKRLYPKHVPKCLRGQLNVDTPCFLHVIQLNPEFGRSTENTNDAAMYDMYTSNLCIGIVTPNPLPEICAFPVYVSLGTIMVTIEGNKQIILTNNEINDLKLFHFNVFNGLLEVLTDFVIIDNSNDTECMFVVPVDRASCSIKFDVLKTKNYIREKREEPKLSEKVSLVVNDETYLHKIVTPWYRMQASNYLVTSVRADLSPMSDFPNREYGTFMTYFAEKYEQKIHQLDQPLVLVKGLSKKLNLLKPKGRETKRKREKVFEELEEILIPELLVKQEFEASLWIHTLLLPSIFTRVLHLLRAEELHRKIAKEAQLGNEISANSSPLELDIHLLNYEPLQEEKNDNKGIIMVINQDEMPAMSDLTVYNKDFSAKMIEAEYPWKDEEEPKDLERHLEVSLTDVEYYEKFIGKSGFNSVNTSPIKTKILPAITYHKDFIEKEISLITRQLKMNGPQLADIYKALTTAKANDIVNLERLETLGDSFLKFITSTYIILKFTDFNEGQCTTLKGRLVSNKNLYYHAVDKCLGGMVRHNDFAKEEWLPPSFKVPDVLQKKILQREISINALFYNKFSNEERLEGNLTAETLTQIENHDVPIENEEESSYSNLCHFLRHQYIGDKFIADVVESLIGVYCETCGIQGGVKFIQWMNIIPQSENLEQLLRMVPPDPVINPKGSGVDFHLPQWKDLESRLGYNFKNKAYLLQAVTHSSYTTNRTTHCYQKLEFLGDAVLDFLITCFIYESCGTLDPGQLTDLRSALVNNNTFASFAVRCGFHKFVLMMNSTLQNSIDKFATYLHMKNYEIDDEVLILLEEEDCNIAEFVDVPKILGDIFESLVGAVYLDSGYSLETVWKVIYKIMWKEIELFSQNVPKNVIRKLFEWPNAYPIFSDPKEVDRKTMVSLEFISNGKRKIVHGFGDNKTLAKKAAAKIALRSLQK